MGENKDFRQLNTYRIDNDGRLQQDEPAEHRRRQVTPIDHITIEKSTNSQPVFQRNIEPDYYEEEEPEAEYSRRPSKARKVNRRRTSKRNTESRKEARTSKKTSNSKRTTKARSKEEIISQKKYKKRRKGLKVAIICVAAFLAILIGGGLLCYFNAKDMLGKVNVLKADLETAVTCVKAKDSEGTIAAFDAADGVIDEVKADLDKPFWKFVAKLPKVGNDIAAVKDVLNIYDYANANILQPFCNVMREFPLSQLKIEGGFNIRMIIAYLNFADTLGEHIEYLTNEIQKVKFEILPAEKITSFQDKFAGIMETYDVFKEYEPMVRVICGTGYEDKFYLIMAQNSAEIRASGGFPGQIGTIRIVNGVLGIGDFESCVFHIDFYQPEFANIPYIEIELFDENYQYLGRDACYNPHFARMAELTLAAYTQRDENYVNGIISLTPIVIERLLKICGAEFTVADGTVVNADNVTQFIQYDLYYKQGTEQYDDAMVNTLFAEVAKTTMKLVTEGFEFDKITEYVNFFKTGFSDRTVMIYMTNPEEEEIIKQCGASGNLNFDPSKPETGIFFSCWDSSRLGMHIDINPQIIASYVNENGLNEYVVEVKYNNRVTQEQIDMGWYVSGHYNGQIPGYIYFFGPAGGSVFDFEVVNGPYIEQAEYLGLEVGYSRYFWIAPGEEVTVRYKVTTAAGADPLVIKTTPTLINAVKME